MAISLRAVGTPVYGTANLTPAIPTAQLTGDMMLCLYGTKPYGDAPTIDQGWTSLGYATDGTVAAGVDVGSMQTRVFYKIATSDTETNPTITNTTNNVSTAVIIVFQKGASDAWVTPVGAGGGDATAGTDFSVTASSDVGHTTGDMVVAAASFRSDAATPTTARAVSITGCTLGTYTQSPTTDPETTSGGDMGMTCGYVPVNSGTSTAAPVMTATLAAAHTGSAYLTRLRVGAVVTATVTMLGVGSITALARLTLAGKATLAGVGGITALGRLILSGKATLSGSGLVSALGSYLHKAQVTMSGVGAITVIGSYLHKAQVVMLGVGAVAAIGTVTGGGSIVTGAAVLTGSGKIDSAGQKVSSNPPFGASVHAVMCNLSFANQTLQDQMKSDVDSWLVGKQTWETTNEPTTNDGGTIIVRFTSSEDMDDFMAFVESRAKNIPAQSGGTIKKHWCGHSAQQSCREIETTTV